MIKLVFPTREHKEIIENYKAELLTENDFIHGSALLSKLNFEDWINLVEDGRYKEKIKSDFVPAHTFLIMDDDKMVGIINVRHELNDYLFNVGGHIGYSVRPSERRKGYAKAGLKLAVEFLFNNFEIEKILVTCSKNNIASKNTILACGGVLENEYIDGDDIKLRFWINK